MSLDLVRRFGGVPQLVAAIAWVVLLAAAVLAYWPGLAGPFVLDDLGSVAALGDYGGVTDWHTFKSFVFGGNAGPTGRPIALLSFLIDGNNWPADAWPFKRTNLVIHMLTGVLLGVLTNLVLKCLDFRQQDRRWIVLVATGLWILHPFLVSTTLYVVQRMAQLSTMFMFAGLALYLHGRLLLSVNKRRAYSVMSAAIGIFTILAMLSKENGILLPILAGVLELTILASQRPRIPALNRYWISVFIFFPTGVIGFYLLSQAFQGSFFEVVPPRDFSLFERFLTQGRVLIEYLQHWYLPKLYTTGVFQDHFTKSTGLFAPFTTVLSFLVHGVAITVAFAKRKQWPLFALTVLFFYANHLLESTVLNLELYFEHRNYGATAFLFLPLVVALYRKSSARTFAVVAVAVLMLLGLFTRYSATVWQSLPSMLEASALKAPLSARGQSGYAKLLFLAGRPDDAIAVIDRAIENIPQDDPLLLMNRLFFLCSRNSLEVAEFRSVVDRLATLPFDSRALKAYNQFAEQVVLGSCPNIEPDSLETMFTRMLELPENSDPASLQYSHIQFLIGYSRMYAKRPAEALEAFEKSLEARAGPSHAMNMAALMASQDYFAEANVLAERALRKLQESEVEDPRLVHKVKESDIRAFLETVRADLASQQDGDIADPGE